MKDHDFGRVYTVTYGIQVELDTEMLWHVTEGGIYVWVFNLGGHG